ncbi:MAG: outer membrane beta-barrel protein [Gemmatimonadota bacterium]|nr:outer membrane beta-barrel protein [Gemmatimonadota bacterium]
MRSRSALVGGLAAALLLAAPAAAQSRSLVLFARGGGYSPLANLNDAGTADIKTGFNVGGGLAVDLHKYIALRGDFDVGRGELRQAGAETGTHLNKFFYGGALQLQYPTAGGIAPYVFGGGGAVTIHEENTSGQNETRGAGTFGAGVRYALPRRGFGVFVEGAGWVYQHRNLAGSTAGFDKTQVDALYSAGISYRLGL